MTNEISASAVGRYLGPSVSAGLGALVTWLAAGSAGIGPGLIAFGAVVSAILGAVFLHIYRRYVGVLNSGGRPKGSLARLTYDSLRQSLTEGNLATRVYARRLTTSLNAVDRFLGDAGMTDRTLAPHVFGLTTPAALWTAASFDRCLLLALIYPFATIFVIWGVSGHVGPAEEALGLARDLNGWKRAISLGAVSLSFVSMWLFIRTSGWGKAFWYSSATLGVLGLPHIGGVNNADGGGALLFAVQFAVLLFFLFGSAERFRQKSAGLGVVSFTLIFSAAIIYPVAAAVGDRAGWIEPKAWGEAILVAFIMFGTFFLAAETTRLLNALASKKRCLGFFQLIVVTCALVTCLVAANLLPQWPRWAISGPVLLFIGLFTLLNAPFDWASVGLTRALLRRGLELGGWWPFCLALVDAGIAGLFVVALAMTMIVGTQAFDYLAVLGGGQPVLPLNAFFDGISLHPTAPEYWWLYALLISTVIPSLINLAVGGASLMRGLPGLPALLLRFMPPGKAVPEFERRWIALVLTLQVAVGAILGVAAQVVVLASVICFVMPWVGLELLDLARDVASYNLPLKIGQLFQNP